jgi:hypothetical protein
MNFIHHLIFHFSSINVHNHPIHPSKIHLYEKFHGFYINENTIKLIIKLMLLIQND